MDPKIRQLAMPDIASYRTWTAVNRAAVAIEESVSQDNSLLEDAFSRLSLSTGPTSSPTPGPSPVFVHSEDDPMEIGAFHRRSAPSGSRPRSGSASGATHFPPHQDRRDKRFHQWTTDGKPICGHCGRVGHLSKKCHRNTNNSNVINQVSEVPVAEESSSSTSPSVCNIQASTTPRFAAIPIQDDPLTSEINNVELSTSPVSSTTATVGTPRI